MGETLGSIPNNAKKKINSEEIRNQVYQGLLSNVSTNDDDRPNV
jgi:hypothetical protein